MAALKNVKAIGLENALRTAVLGIGIGLGGGVGGSVLIGLGGNLLTPFVDDAVQRLCGRIKSLEPIINEDLQFSLTRGAKLGVAQLKHEFFTKKHQGLRIANDRSLANLKTHCEVLFEILATDMETILAEGKITQLAGNAESITLFQKGLPGANEALQLFLDPYLVGHDQQLQTFVRAELAAKISHGFAVDLKKKGEENAKAWRAYQRLILDGLMDAAGVQIQHQAEIIKQLTEWKARMDNLPATEREETGRKGLNRIDARFRKTWTLIRQEADRIINEQTRQGELTREANRIEAEKTRCIVETGVELIRLDLKELGIRRAPDPVHVSANITLPWNVPIHENKLLVGRDALLTTITRELAGPAATPRKVALHGLGGVGKSQVAAAYAYHRRAEGLAIIWWIAAETEASLQQSLAALATSLQAPGASGIDIPADAKLAIGWLESTDRPWLLLYDNAEEKKVISDHLPKLGNGEIVITSQLSTWLGLASAHEVNELSVDEGADFLTRRTGKVDAVSFRAITTELGGLPLALEQAGAYLEFAASPATYFAKLQTSGADLLESGDVPEDHKRSVGKTFEIAIQRFHNDEAAADLLNLCAWLGPELIPLDLIAAQTDELPPALNEALSSQQSATELIGRLARYSLIDVIDERTISVHRLLQDVIRRFASEQAQYKRAITALRVINAAFPNPPDEVARWPDSARLLPHALAVTADSREQMIEEDYLLGRLLNHTGLYLKSRALYLEARSLYKRALVIVMANLGSEHQDVSTILNNLGGVLLAEGDLSGARKLFEHALAIVEAKLGPDHPDVAIELNNLGSLLMEQRELSGARLLLERALMISESKLGPDHPDVAIRLSNLGLVLKAQGDLKGARALYERAIAIGEANLGPDHPDLAIRLSNLGLVLKEQGDLSSARLLSQRALAIVEAKLGLDHPTVATYLNNLGNMLKDQGDHSGARRRFERALEISEAKLGTDHPDVAILLNNLGNLLQGKGDLTGARVLHERALGISLRYETGFVESFALFRLSQIALAEARNETAVRILALTLVVDTIISSAQVVSDERMLREVAAKFGREDEVDQLIEKARAEYERDRGVSWLAEVDE